MNHQVVLKKKETWGQKDIKNLLDTAKLTDQFLGGTPWSGWTICGIWLSVLLLSRGRQVRAGLIQGGCDWRWLHLFLNNDWRRRLFQWVFNIFAIFYVKREELRLEKQKYKSVTKIHVVLRVIYIQKNYKLHIYEVPVNSFLGVYQKGIKRIQAKCKKWINVQKLGSTKKCNVNVFYFKKVITKKWVLECSFPGKSTNNLLSHNIIIDDGIVYENSSEWVSEQRRNFVDKHSYHVRLTIDYCYHFILLWHYASFYCFVQVHLKILSILPEMDLNTELSYTSFIRNDAISVFGPWKLFNSLLCFGMRDGMWYFCGKSGLD